MILPSAAKSYVMILLTSAKEDCFILPSAAKSYTMILPTSAKRI